MKVKDEILIDGVEALAMGAIAEDVIFFPLSIVSLHGYSFAQHSKEFGIIVEQAEDEISAMNM